MSECLTADELTTLTGALRWDVDATLQHVAGCVECRAVMRQIAVVHEMLTVSEPVSEARMAETLSLIDREAAPATGGAPAPGTAKPDRVPAALLAVVAATMTALLLLPAPMGPSTPFSPVWAVIFAVLIGTAVGLRYARRAPGIPAGVVSLRASPRS